MKHCQSCGKENLDASQFCEECGARLSPENARQQEEARARVSSEQSVYQSSSGATSVGIPLPVPFEPQVKESYGGGSKSANGGAAHATLIIERGNSTGFKFALRSDESNIGRWDADNGVFPDIDLDKHDPEAKISRRHARILRRNGNEYFIEDLGSTNGTFVNRGRRLIPGDETALRDGDEIIIGKTFLRFHVGE